MTLDALNAHSNYQALLSNLQPVLRELTEMIARAETH